MNALAHPTAWHVPHSGRLQAGLGVAAATVAAVATFGVVQLVSDTAPVADTGTRPAPAGELVPRTCVMPRANVQGDAVLPMCR